MNHCDQETLHNKLRVSSVKNIFTGKKYFENPIYEIKKQNQQKSKFIIVNILFLITISTFKTKPNSEKIEI